jgi:hypothetical protein
MSWFIIRGVLEDVSNKISQRHVESQAFVGEGDCNIIDSPPAFGAFDLGINCALNEQSPLYQSL